MAGRRRVGKCDLDLGRAADSSDVEGVRLTSLFGVGGGAAGCVGESIGAPEPWEKAMDVESGPTLDRGLSCCEEGRIESLLIHELLDEKDVLGVSAIVLT